MQDNGNKREPKAVSPTPLRDWIHRLTGAQRAAGVGLFALLIASGGLAPASLSITPVPGSQQLLFVLLAGALLGSRLGAIASLVFLAAAAVTGLGWPAGSAPAPLIGPTAGFLWSLPMAAYLAGWGVDRWKGETAAHYGIGVFAAIAVYHSFGVIRLISALDVPSSEAFVSGAGVFVGQHIAHAALAVLIASTASDLARARAEK